MFGLCSFALVIHRETDGQMMTEREGKRKRRGGREGGREGGSEMRRERTRGKEESTVTSCCPGKTLDGLGFCHFRQEDGDQNVKNSKRAVLSFIMTVV